MNNPERNGPEPVAPARTISTNEWGQFVRTVTLAIGVVLGPAMVEHSGTEQQVPFAGRLEAAPPPPELKTFFDTARAYIFDEKGSLTDLEKQFEALKKKYSKKEDRAEWEADKKLLDMMEDTFLKPDPGQKRQRRAAEAMGALGEDGKACIGRLVSVASLAQKGDHPDKIALSTAAERSLDRIGEPTTAQVADLCNRFFNPKNNVPHRIRAFTTMMRNKRPDFIKAIHAEAQKLEKGSTHRLTSIAILREMREDRAHLPYRGRIDAMIRELER